MLYKGSRCDSFQLRLETNATYDCNNDDNELNAQPFIMKVFHTTYLTIWNFFVFLLLHCRCIKGNPELNAWEPHHASYDASIDPIAWSRAFVKDTIRKPRHFESLHRTITTADDNTHSNMVDNGPHYFKKSRSRSNLGYDSNDEDFWHATMGKRARKLTNRKRKQQYIKDTAKVGGMIMTRRRKNKLTNKSNRFSLL